MTKTQTHTVSTQYGEAEIETYECDSCGNRVAYENTVEFSIGDRSGRACNHCEESGPISWPKKVIGALSPNISYGFGFMAVLFAPVSIMVIVAEAAEEDRRFERGIILGWGMVFFWVVLPMFLYLVF